MSDLTAGIAQAGASMQAATHALSVANAQGQVAVQLIEEAVQQVGPNESGKGEHIDEQA